MLSKIATSNLAPRSSSPRPIWAPDYTDVAAACLRLMRCRSNGPGFPDAR
jgi:hypothetical protein